MILREVLMKKIFVILVAFTLLFATSAFAQEQNLEQKIKLLYNDEIEKDIAWFIELEKEMTGKYKANDFNFVMLAYRKGNAYKKSLEYNIAEKEYKKAESILKQLGNNKKEELAGLQSKIGDIWFGIGRYPLALEWYNKALVNCTELYGEKSYESGNLYNSLGNIYSSQGNYKKATEFYNKSLEIINILEGEDSINAGILYGNLGSVAYGAEKYDEALKLFEKTLKIIELNNGKDSPNAAPIYSNIGDVYSALGDLDRALVYYKEAIRINEKSFGANHPGNINLYGNYANALCDAERFYDALDYWLRSLDLSLAYKSFTVATSNILRQFADFWVSIIPGAPNDYFLKWDGVEKELKKIYNGVSDAESQKAFRSFIPDYKGAHSPYDLAVLLCNMALPLLQYVNNAEDSQTAIACYITLGNANFYEGKYDEAISNLKKAEDLINKHENLNSVTGIVYSNLGECYYKKGDENTSITYYNKAFKAFSYSRDYNDIFECMGNLLHYNFNNTKFIQSAIDFGIQSTEKARLESISLKSNFQKKALPLYYNALEYSINNLKNEKQAFEYSEAMKSRGFLDQLGTETALNLDGVTQSEKTKIHTLSEKISESRRMIERGGETTSSQAVTELEAAEKELANLDAEISKRIPKYSQLRNPKSITAEEAQKWIGNNRTVLEYIIWNDDYRSVNNREISGSSYCIALSKDKIKVFELDKNYDYSSAVNRIRNAITSLKPEKDFEKERNELYSKLLEPVTTFLENSSEVLIVPDINLSFLPFDILRKNSSSNEFGQEHSVTFIPSVSVSSLLSKSKKDLGQAIAFGGAWYNKNLSANQHKSTLEKTKTSADRKFQVINTKTDELSKSQQNYAKKNFTESNPVNYFSSKNFFWNDLPGTLLEVTTLQKNVFNSKNLLLKTQEEATEKNLKELSKNGTLAKYPILHFACHGYFDNNIAEMCSIVFSEVSGLFSKTSTEDGYLTVSEVSELNLNADMVCLSACETGLGEIRAGDGIVGLSRAFMVAGARNVGVSLWSVDDSATCAFMERMYKKRKDGMSYAEAYRSVKNEFRKDPKYSHPFYWAAFALYGGSHVDDNSKTSFTMPNIKDNDDWPFPIYGLTLGESTKNDIIKVSATKSENDDYEYYVKGHNFRCNTNGTLLMVNLSKDSPWPEELLKKGYNKNFSYSQWKKFFISKGYSIVSSSPQKLVVARKTPIYHDISIDFYEKGKKSGDLIICGNSFW